MKIEVIGRHENKSQEIKDYARDKAKKLIKYFNNISRVQVILDNEKDKHAVEMIISVSRGQQLVGSMAHQDGHAAIDLLMDKMERQLVRFKERLRGHRHVKGVPPEPESDQDVDDELSYEEIIRKKYKGKS